MIFDVNFDVNEFLITRRRYDVDSTSASYWDIILSMAFIRHAQTCINADETEFDWRKIIYMKNNTCRYNKMSTKQTRRRVLASFLARALVTRQ